MVKKQVSKSEQLLPNLSIVLDYDQPIRSSEEILKVLNKYLNDECHIEKFDKNKNVYCYEHDGIKDCFLVGAITYLSKPHPLFKKRLQLKKWFKDYYNANKNDYEIRVHLLGIYNYNDLVVFVDFNIEDYIGNKMNSSAAHVYSNDLYQAFANDIFNKVDKSGNRITTISGRNFNDYLCNRTFENDIFKVFKYFNTSFNFDEWILASDAIIEMKKANWYQWKGAEWPGWWLEFKIADYLKTQKYENLIIYIGSKKTKDMLDFDLYFPKDCFYGDIKASDINKKQAPGNDQENVLKAINQNNRIWYVVYEHETVKDNKKNNEMAKARMELIGNRYKEGDKISYTSRMKHSVNFKQMHILELNKINMNDVLSEFNQGHQPDGNKRKPKFLINKKNIDNYIVFSYRLKE